MVICVNEIIDFSEAHESHVDLFSHFLFADRSICEFFSAVVRTGFALKYHNFPSKSKS
jgi:hypothetical protein